MICNIFKIISKINKKCEEKIVEIVNKQDMIIMDVQQTKLYQRERNVKETK